MKIKKSITLLLILSLALTLLTGCSVDQNITLKKDFSGHLEQTIFLTDKEWSGLKRADYLLQTYADKDGNLATGNEKSTLKILDATENGISGKKVVSTIDFSNPTEFEEMSNNAMSMTYNKNYFCLSSSATYTTEELSGEDATGSYEEMLGSYEAMLDLLGLDLSSLSLSEVKATTTITFPYSVIDSNGTISKDKKTVSWNSNELRFYAVFKDTESKNAPVFSGAKNKKAYNGPVTLDIDSEVLLISVKVNGQSYEADRIFFTEDGTYTATAKDSSNKSSKITFTIDTIKPTVKGVADGKTYSKTVTIKFSDDGSGVKKATLKSSATKAKTIKNKTKVSKKGSYTLTVVDKAGNTKTVNFKVG